MFVQAVAIFIVRFVKSALRQNSIQIFGSVIAAAS
jgi:hypothetical protein